MPNGNIATNGKENMSVLFLDPTLSVSSPIIVLLTSSHASWDFRWSWCCHQQIENCQKPRPHGIPTEAYKAMNSRTRCRIHRYVAAFFEHYPGWHQSQVSLCQKKEISLTRTSGAAWCSQKNLLVVMNGWAFHLLELHGTKFQFGGTPGLRHRESWPAPSFLKKYGPPKVCCIHTYHVTMYWERNSGNFAKCWSPSWRQHGPGSLPVSYVSGCWSVRSKMARNWHRRPQSCTLAGQWSGVRMRTQTHPSHV